MCSLKIENPFLSWSHKDIIDTKTNKTLAYVQKTGTVDSLGNRFKMIIHDQRLYELNRKMCKNADHAVYMIKEFLKLNKK